MRLLLGLLVSFVLAVAACWLLLRSTAPLASVAGGPSEVGPVEADPVAADPAVVAPAVEHEPVRDDVTPPQNHDTIAGTVIDEDGRPVAAAALWLDGRDAERTDAHGRFAFSRREGDTSAIAIRVVAPPNDDETLEWAGPDQWVEWGTGDLRFVLRRMVDLEVVLVDASGRPASGEVAIDPAWQTSGWLSHRISETREGSALFANVGRGPCRILVTSEELGRPLHRVIDITGPTRTTIVVPAAASRVVVVTDADGKPPRRSSVQLQDDRGERLDRSDVDETGQALLRGAAGCDYSLRIVGDHDIATIPNVRLDDPSPLRVIVTRRCSASLHVRFEPPSGDRILYLRSSDGSGRGPGVEGPDGTRSFENLAAGEWTMFGQFECGSPSCWCTLLRVGLHDGETKNVVLSAAVLQTGRLDTQVTCVAKVEGCIHLQWEPDDSRRPAEGREVAFPVELGPSDVPPGRYRARVRRVPQALSDEVVDVPGGGEVDGRFHVRLGSVTLRLVDGGGRPARDARVALQRGGIVTRYDVLPESNGDGMVRSQCGVGRLDVVLLPFEPYHPTTAGEAMLLGGGNLSQSKEARTLLGTVTVAEGQTAEATFVVGSKPR